MENQEVEMKEFLEFMRKRLRRVTPRTCLDQSPRIEEKGRRLPSLSPPSPENPFPIFRS